MNLVAEELKIAFSDVYTFSLKLQNYHWNVEGPLFYQYHKLFGDIYEEVNGSIDTIAELIKTLGEVFPVTLSRIQALTNISEEEGIPLDAKEMLKILSIDNDKVIASLLMAYRVAESAGHIGISNYIQDRVQMHQKHSWFLKASQRQ